MSQTAFKHNQEQNGNINPYMYPNIHKLLDMCKQGTPKYDFGSRIDLEYIKTYEKASGIVLPDSYRHFLELFNGGMIKDHRDSFYTDMLDYEPDGPIWSSFYFFPFREMKEKYLELRLDDFLMDDDFDGTYPIIPICRLPGWGKEFLFVFSNKGLKKESPVFAYFTDKDCIQLADNFDQYLGWHVEHQGFPPIEDDTDRKLCSDFITRNRIFKIASQKETSAERMKRLNASIKIDPNDALTYCERGNMLSSNNKIEAALKDFNKAIELDSNEAFYYHCRGDLILNYGSPRKALIDLDIAAQMKPDNLMYVSGRADALFKIGQLEKALIDCNKVLKVNPKFFLALDTRQRVYKAMGKDKLAQADEDTINDLE